MEYPSTFTCEATRRRLERYVANLLARDEALAVAEHLEACPSCAPRVLLIRLTIGVRDLRHD